MRNSRTRDWVLLGGLAAVVLFFGLGQDRLLRMDDEGLYVRIAQEMFAHHDWTVTTWFGGPGWFKPPGLYWSMFPWFALLGPTLLAGRMAAACWGALTLVATAAFGTRAGGARGGLLSALLLLTCCSFVKYARVGMMEAALLFFYVACLYCLYRAQQRDGPQWVFWCLLLTGASTLIKGPVTAIILTLTAVFYSAVLRDWGFWRSRAALAGAIVGLAFVLLWPAMVLVRGAWQAWWSFFIVRENLGKFDNIFYSPLNIWGMFLGHAAPWSLVFVGVTWRLVRGGVWRQPAILLNLLFVASLLTFFTLPATRLSWYSVPALPEAALIMGLGLAREPQQGRWEALVTAALLGGAGLFLATSPRAFELGAGRYGAILGGLAALLAAGLLATRRWIPAAAALAGVYVGLAWVGLRWPFPYVTDQACRLLGPEQPHPPYLVRLSPYGLSYAIDRLAVQVTTEPELQQALDGGGRALISASDLAHFQQDGLRRYQTLTAWPTLRRNLPATDLWLAWWTSQPALTQESLLVIGQQQQGFQQQPSKQDGRSQDCQEGGCLKPKR